MESTSLASVTSGEEGLSMRMKTGMTTNGREGLLSVCSVFSVVEGDFLGGLSRAG
jgi:hypothetical protein